MNITSEGHQMPKKPIMSASRAKTKKKKYKPNEQYQDVEKPVTWAQIFEESIDKLDGGFNVEDFMKSLTENYHPPKKKSAY